MNYSSINIQDKFSKFTDHWAPKIIAQLNDYHLKLAKVQGEFVWHDHPETDEVFIVIKGHLDILFCDGKVSLVEGEMFVVPKGLEHKPVAKQECHILLIEPAGLVNTGNAANSELTAPNDVWI
ncbi:MAG: cupin domain-containing protein [Chloroflexota bacterium]